MKNSLLIGMFMSLSTCVIGQVGFNGGYNNFVADEWTELISGLTDKNFDNPTGYRSSIDYRFRLKQRRVEFLPELGFVSVKSSTLGSEVKMKSVGFFFNTNIYPFDFEGDCDCPTWSKSGGVFEKGFFIQVSPGFSWMGINVEDGLNFRDENVNYFSLGIGAGVDLGLAEWITVSPMIRYSISQKTEYLPVTNSLKDFGPAESIIKQFYLGLRFGLNFKK